MNSTVHHYMSQFLWMTSLLLLLLLFLDLPQPLAHEHELPLLICYVLMTRHARKSFLFFKWTDLLISISIDAGDSSL